MSQLKILSQALVARFFRPRSVKALVRLQQRKLNRTNAYVAQTFDRASLPEVLSKADSLKNFAKLNILKMPYEEALRHASEGTTVGEIHFGLSTGTSGSRGVFMTSNEERAFWAGAVIGRCLPSLVKPTRIAYFLRSDNKLYHAVQTGRRFQLKHFDLETELDLTELEAFKPDVIMAPSYILARIALSSYSGQPSLVITSADVLDPWDEKAIRDRFQRLHHIYQATEGFLGASCAQGTLHLNEDLLLFERRMLDEKHFVPILTDFHRRSQAVVRLELSDVLRLGKCSCGSPLTALERVDGRLDEIFSTPRFLYRGDLAAALTRLPLAGVDFRFIQKSPHEFVLKTSRFADEIASALRARLIEAGINAPVITVEPEFALKLYEKRRRFVSEVKADLRFTDAKVMR